MSEVDRLEAAISECREMIREAHAATKDLRTAVREAKKELRELAKDEVAGQVHSEVTRQLDELRERTSEAVSAATQKVIAEFDRFGESLLGKETYWKTASGRRSARRPETDVVELEVPKEESVNKDTTVAVDIAKNVFEIAVSNRPGHVSERRRCSRTQMMAFFRGRTSETVVLEACGSAHQLGRDLQGRVVHVGQGGDGQQRVRGKAPEQQAHHQHRSRDGTRDEWCRNIHGIGICWALWAAASWRRG